MTRSTSRTFTLTSDDIMRTFLGGTDFFDRVSALRGTSGNFPPFNVREIESAKGGDATYLIEIAVAGYTRDEITIEEENGVLTVRGEKLTGTSDDLYLYRGIAERDFHREWALAEHVRVDSAGLEDGLLKITLVREVPEAAKPRAITIK